MARSLCPLSPEPDYSDMMKHDTSAAQAHIQTMPRTGEG